MPNLTRILHVTSLLVLALLVTAGCSADPKRIRLTDDPLDVQLAALRTRKGLTVEETRLLYGYLARSRFESVEGPRPQLAGRTVGELITEQRNWEQTHADLIAKGQQRDSEWKTRVGQIQREMESVIVIRVVEVNDPENQEPARGHGRDVVVRLAIENVGTRTVAQVEGAVRFADVYGRELLECSVTLKETLPPRESVERLLHLECAPAFDQETRVRQVRLQDTKNAWEPRMILFEDGGVLAISDE
jgi:hypothetical protein